MRAGLAEASEQTGGQAGPGCGLSPGGSHFLGVEQSGVCLGEHQARRLLPGPDEALVHKRPRLAKMLCPPRLPGAERETRRGHERRQTV